MTTDKERREVARRLRSLDDSELQVYDMTYFAIQSAVGGDGDQCPDGRELADRLADLIEPSDSAQTVAEEMFGQMRHSTEQERVAYADMMSRNSVELHPVDRDALLELADEMVEAFRLGAFTGEGLDAKWCRELHDKYARCIREALGVES